MLVRRHKVKIVIQINRFCRDSVVNADCSNNRAYALSGIRNMIKDYEVTHAMEQGKDYEIVAIVHSGGAWQMLKNDGFDGNGNTVTGRNQYEGLVSGLITDGVRFYVGQNSIRGFIEANRLPAGDEVDGATSELIEGVGYVTHGIAAIADFQSRGYTYVQP